MGRRAQGFRVVPGRRPGDPYYVRFTHLGRRRYLSTGARDPRFAAERAAAVYAYIVSNRARPRAFLNHATRVDAYAAQYLEQLEATGSRERYAMQMVHFRAHLLRAFRELRDLEDESRWQDYIAMRGRAGVSGSTVTKELSTLRMFAEWCRSRRFIESVPKGPRMVESIE